jgi:VWFA-related protein
MPFTLSRRRSPASLVAWLALLAGAALAVVQAQAPPTPTQDRQAPAVTFRVDINFVEIPAVVVDREGRFMEGLRQEDFEIFEDGKPQTIASFSVVEKGRDRLGPRLFLKQAAEPDVQTNAVPFDGRLYVLLMDDLHVQASNSARTRQAARLFVESQVGDGDLAAVVCTGGGPGASQDFTSNRALLLDAIERFMGRSLPPSTESRIEDYTNPLRSGRSTSSRGGGPPKDSAADERAYNARVTLGTIRRLSDALAAIRGRRKAVVLFSEGMDAAIGNITAGATQTEGASVNASNLLPGAAGETQRDARDTISAAIRANVSIYGVSPRGLDLEGGRADLAVPVSADPELRLDLSSMEADRTRQSDGLQVISSETGGFAAINTNDFARAFDRIREDNSRYYLLGYYPADSARNGKYHTLDVRVRRPGVSVRARAGYLALRKGAVPSGAPAETKNVPPALREALSSPLPVPGIRLAVSAVAFIGSPPNALVTVVVQADGRDLQFRQTEGRYEGALSIAVIATDAAGRVKNSLTRTLTMPLRPESYQQVKTSGIRAVESLELPPGRYRLRIAAQDSNSLRVGTVHYDLDVPDFETLPLSMSGLLLTSSLAGVVPTAPGEQLDRLRKVLPGPPSVARVFRAGEVLALVADIYDRQIAAHTVDIITTVRSVEGRECVRLEDHRTSAEFAAHTGAFRYAPTIPLKGLAPGLYALTVEARSRLGAGGSVRRDAPFEIVP